jgi:hypothetical protein
MSSAKLSVREQVLVRKITDILVNHIGEKNAITARNISIAVGIEDGDTFIRTRGLIEKAIRIFRLPVAATTNSGYFFIANEDELSKYQQSLDGRKLEIEGRKQIVSRNFAKHYRKTVN